MTWRKWDFETGQSYLLSEVLGACETRLREGGVLRPESKSRMVKRIEHCGHSRIVWRPETEKGWGASAFNLNCWRTIDGEPIVPPEHKRALGR